MLAMAAANVVGATLFGALYAAAGARYLSHGAYLACLAILVVLVTTLWLRVESRHRSLAPLRRLGRITGGLVLTAILVPAVVLTRLFWLDAQLPPEAGLRGVLGPVMALTLIALALTTAVNVIGGVIVAGRGLARSRARSDS